MKAGFWCFFSHFSACSYPKAFMARCWVNTPPRGFRRARGTWRPWRWAAEMVKLRGDRTQFTIEWWQISNVPFEMFHSWISWLFTLKPSHYHTMAPWLLRPPGASQGWQLEELIHRQRREHRCRVASLHGQLRHGEDICRVKQAMFGAKLVKVGKGLGVVCWCGGLTKKEDLENKFVAKKLRKIPFITFIV